MIYIFVLFGSFAGICAILGARVLLRNRNIRKFVRGVKQRTLKAQERGLSMRETSIEKPHTYTNVNAADKQKVRSLLRDAEKVAGQKKYDQAERLLIQVLTIVPHSIEARAELGKIYLLTDANAKAEALYRELVSESSDVSFYANLGLACYKQANFECACEAYQEALNLDPKNPERAAALGRSCMAAKRFSEACELLERASERLARDTDLLHMLATCYERAGDLRGAEDAYYRIHRLQPYDEAVKEKLSALASV